MKITCPRKEFFEAVSAAGQAANARTSVNILQTLKIEASGSTIRVVGCDGEMWVERRLSSVIEEEGAICVPAKLLVDIVNSLPDGDVHLTTSDGTNVLLTHGASEYRLHSLDPIDFPDAPDFGGESNLALSLGDFRDAVDSVIFAVSTDPHRQNITGVQLSYDGETLRLVATDTHRLAVREIAKSGIGSSITAVVPAKALRAIQALPFSDEVGIELNFGNGRVGVATDTAKIVTQLLTDKYPNWERVVPAESTRSWSLERDQLGSKVRRAMIVAKDSASRLRFKGNEETLLIAARSEEKGDAKEELNMISTNGDLEIAFNGKYVLDALEPITGPGIKVEMTESMRPAVFRSADEEKHYFCVIMPMSLM
ncbi:MAG: DNA polymerase III subunit beta [Armatimonadetes bacterium]|nr:DNA polymerase III subunit beta [Armatimonadota bacterium]MBS1728520.1 DNA polymerase III subunit beta [Armatimonadota bacterium]